MVWQGRQQQWCGQQPEGVGSGTEGTAAVVVCQGVGRASAGASAEASVGHRRECRQGIGKSVDSGAAGTSSGAAGHRQCRGRDGGGSGAVRCWQGCGSGRAGYTHGRLPAAAGAYGGQV